MKTVSFRELEVGRAQGGTLLHLDTVRDRIALEPGLTVLVAPNGHGKTTLFQTIAGVLNARKGAMLVGTDRLDPSQDLVYVSEYLTFPKFIYPPEWIEFLSGRSWKELEPQLRPWLDEFRLTPLLRKFLGRMSQGERRKVTWLGTHASTRPIALLDEPLDGLDLYGIQAARHMLQAWRQEKRTICIVAHQVGELLDLADQVWLIRDSKIVPWDRAIPERAQSLSSDGFRKHVLEFYKPAPNTVR